MQVVKDWQLVLVVTILLGIMIVMAILGVAVPQLRADPQLLPDQERPTGVTVRMSQDTTILPMWMHLGEHATNIASHSMYS